MQTVNFYKIISANTDKCYVGSTGKTLEERLHKHEKDYKYFQEGKYPYTTSFEILEFKNYSIQLIETKDCKDRFERDTIECKHIIYTANTVNKVMPRRTQQQYYQDNKEHLNTRHLQYYTENKQHIQHNAQQKHVCQCSGKYTTQNKSTHEKTQKHQTFIRNQNQIINGNNNVININIYNAPQPQ